MNTRSENLEKIAKITGFEIEKGDKISLINMPNDPNPIEEGTTGIITGITFLGRDEAQIQVEWENGRTLSLICPPDRFKKL